LFISVSITAGLCKNRLNINRGFTVSRSGVFLVMTKMVLVTACPDTVVYKAKAWDLNHVQLERHVRGPHNEQVKPTLSRRR